MKQSIFFVVILVCFIKLSESVEPKCESTWSQFQNKCFFVNSTIVKRSENVANCRKLNATLVSIHSQQENDFVRRMLRIGHWYWLGGQRIQVGSHLAKWDDGSKFNYTSRFHNAISIHQKGYDYLQIYPDGDWMYYKEDEVDQLCQRILYELPEKLDNETKVGNETMKGYEVDEILNVTNLVNTTQELNKTFECESGWHRYINKCFYVNETKVNRMENIRNCAKLNATLVSIHSEAENKYITSFLPYITWYWLGGERSKRGSTVVKWIDGSQYNYSAHWFYADEEEEENDDEGNNFVQMHKDSDWRFYSKGDKVLQLCQKNVSTVEEIQTVTEKIAESTTTGPKTEQKCPENWHKFQNKCFWVNNTDVRREENEMNCLRMASVMVSIHSKEENNFLASITNHGFYWLGGRRDTTPNAKTRWDDGTPFNFENWRREHFRESELFNFIQFQKGFWIYFRNDRVSQLCQKQLADDSQQSPNSSSVNNVLLNQLVNTMNDNFASINEKMNVVNTRFISLSSSVSSSNQKSDQMKTDLNKLKENVDSRLKILSEQLSKVAIKEEATTKKCKEGWTQWKNKCYQLIRSTDNFNSQKSRCKSMNASIVAIRSQEENDFITANFNRITAWLGAQREVGHRWKWHDGTDLIYTNWNEGEPNNLEGEDCIQYYNNIGHAGYWNDYPCTRHESVICEITLKGNEEEVTTKIPFEEYECDEGWFRFEQKCYFSNKSEVTRKENENYCKALNASLTSIHSREENNFLNSNLNAKRKYWTAGQRDKSDRSKFIWTDGTKWIYRNWGQNEPTSSESDACVVLASGKYSNDDCDAKHSQLCSKPAMFKGDNNTIDQPLNEKFVSDQLSEMKNEIAQLMQNIHEKPEKLIQTNTSSNAHIYVFSFMFILVFALFAYFIATIYQRRRFNSSGALLEMRDNESL